MSDQAPGRGLRRALVGALRRVRERLADPAQPEPVTSALAADDVRLDAFQVLRKAGVGYDFVFVDVREPDERAATGVIEGAVLLPLVELPTRLRALDREATVVAYCDDGSRSDRAALLLRAAGFDDAWSMGGGLRAWRKDGGEVEPAPGIGA